MNISKVDLSLIQSSNYTGTDAGVVLTEAIESAVMMNEANAVHYLNVPYKLNVMQFATLGVLSSPYTCDFVGGDINLEEVVLEPARFTLQASFCKTELWQNWLASRKGQGVENDGTAVTEFVDNLLFTYLSKLDVEIDNLIWNASTSTGVGVFATFDGLIAQMLLDANVIDITATTIDETTVLAAMASVITNTPEAVSSHPDFRIYMGQKTWYFYQQALGLAPYGNSLDSVSTQKYLQASIVVVPKFPADTIVATHKGNIVIGSDMTSPKNAVMIVDGKLQGSDKIGIRIDYTLDAKILRGGEVVLYSPLV